MSAFTLSYFFFLSQLLNVAARRAGRVRVSLHLNQPEFQCEREKKARVFFVPCPFMMRNDGGGGGGGGDWLGGRCWSQGEGGGGY